MVDLRRATKIICLNKKLDYQSRLQKLELTTLEERRIRGDLIQQYKINTSVDKVNWYKPNITIPSQKLYDTRSHPYSMTKQLVKNCAISSNFFTNRIVNN